MVCIKVETIYEPWLTERPCDGDVVQINIILSLAEEGEKVVENSRKRKDTPISFVLGSSDVIEGINVALRLFGKGERSKVRISSDLAYGE